MTAPDGCDRCGAPIPEAERPALSVWVDGLTFCGVACAELWRRGIPAAQEPQGIREQTGL